MSNQEELATAMERAEREFTRAAAKGDWLGSAASDSVPPWWAAGAGYVLTIMRARTQTAFRTHSNSAVRLLWDSLIPDEALRVYSGRLLPYERASNLTAQPDRASEFVAFVNRTIRTELSALFVNHLETSLKQLRPAANTTTPEVRGSERESRLTAFIRRRRVSITAVVRAANVKKSDRQKWRHGEMSDDSVMAQRIEDVLAERRPLKSEGLSKARR
jgi:hypothetical protein